MPSPSPNSRKTGSPVATRNLAVSTRGGLPGPTRGLLQGTGSNSLSASRSPYDRSDDHKENTTENTNGRGIQGRPNQNLRGASKKPWVTHFSKPAGTLSPSSRILVDSNSSSSPLRSGGVVQGYAEGVGNLKARATPPKEHEEGPPTPGPVKGVAELSKRIQQFLEEQDVVLGIKTGSTQEVASSNASVTPVDLGQHSVSSPYNPYKSPFFERPKFLRLNGSSAASTVVECNTISSLRDVADTALEQTTEELPLFEGGQVLATPLQQIQFSINLSPISTEDDDIKAHTDELQDQPSEATIEGALYNAVQANIHMVTENKEDCSHEPYEKASQALPFLMESFTEAIDHAVRTDHFINQSQVGDMEAEIADGKESVVVKAKVQSAPRILMESLTEGLDHAVGTDHFVNQSQVGDMEVEIADGKESVVVKAKIQSAPGELVSQREGKEAGTGEVEYKHQFQEIASQSQAEEVQPPQDKEVAAEVAYEDLEDVKEEACGGNKAGRVLSFGTILAVFIIFVLLSSAGPGLLPASLANNPVHSYWHSSKYQKNCMLLLHGMEGLWSPHDVYLPVDVRVIVGTSADILHSIIRLSTQAHLELQIFAELTSSIIDDWQKILLQHLLTRKNPNSNLEQEDRGRQFEWLHDYEFEEEWLDESPILAYTDWELLHEYDLGAANEFILGSIPEVLKHDLWRNFSQLSDSPDVKGLLEDLMKLKGGNTEEDRLEVLQYFWEYTRFSGSVCETLTQSQVGQIEMENGSQHQTTSLGSPIVDPSEELSTIECGGPSDQKPTDGPTNEEQQDTQAEHGKHHEQYLTGRADADSYMPFTDGPGPLNLAKEESTDQPDFSRELQDCLEEHSKLNEQYLNKEAEPTAALFPQMGIEKEPPDVVLEVTWTSEQLQESHKNFPSNVPALSENAVVCTEELESASADILITKIQPAFGANLDITHLVTLAIFVVASMFALARSRQSKSAAKLAPPVSTSVQFLRKADPLQESLDNVRKERQSFTDAKHDEQQVTMIEELNEKLASQLKSPEPSLLPLQSLQTTGDEDLHRSRVSTSACSPYGSFTTYKLMSKKEGQAGETKLTPIRRSSRIRNHITKSPQTTAVKRIAISPP